VEVEPRFRSLEFQDLFARIIRSAAPGVPGRLWSVHSPGCWSAWWIGGLVPCMHSQFRCRME